MTAVYDKFAKQYKASKRTISCWAMYRKNRYLIWPAVKDIIPAESNEKVRVQLSVSIFPRR
jgi:hypothetical protein